MKRRHLLGMAAATAGGIGIFSCAEKKSENIRKKLFSFIHYSDCHVQPESGAKEGLLAAIEKMNSLNPDFVVGGGDYMMDCLGQDEARATLLYDIYEECCSKFTVPVHNVMGNHDVFGVYFPDKVPETHPLWGKEMFKKRLGNGTTYSSFDHKGVHFILLDSIQLEKRTDKPGYEYYGGIGAEQMEWLKKDLENVSAETPVIAFSHIPLFTLYEQITNGPTTPSSKMMVITDGKELYETLNKKNFFGYLQGHIHVNELYQYKNVKFVDTGSVAAAWWSGPRDGHPEGFNLVNVYEDGIDTEYITYGWDAKAHAVKKSAFNDHRLSFTV